MIVQAAIPVKENDERIIAQISIRVLYVSLTQPHIVP